MGGGGFMPPPPPVPAGVPPQCAAGFDLWSRDCLNGTFLKTISGEGASLGECCAACGNRLGPPGAFKRS
jgi:hypothetical protein